MGKTELKNLNYAKKNQQTPVFLKRLQDGSAARPDVENQARRT